MNHHHHPFVVLLWVLLWLTKIRPVRAAYNATKLQIELNDAKQLWESRNVTLYKLTSKRECFCLPKFTQSLVMEVKDAKIVQVTDVNGHLVEKQVRDTANEVKALFAEVQDAIDRQATNIEVEFCPEYGRPKQIKVYDNQSIEDNFVLELFDFSPYSRWQEELNRAKHLWSSYDMQEYGYGYQRQCDSCPLELIEPMRIHVKNDTIKEANYRDNHIPVQQYVLGEEAGAPTITEIFDLLQDAIDDRAAEMIVAYDRTYGYPVYVYVDYDKRVANDELILLCGTLMPYSTLRRQLRLEEKNWNSFGIVSYTYTYQRDCTGTYCSDTGIQLAKLHTIQVVDEQIAAVDGHMLNNTENSTAITRSSAGLTFTAFDLPTIPDLFDKIQDALDTWAYIVEAKYDPYFGYPTQIFIDQYASTPLDASLSATVKLVSVEKQSDKTNYVDENDGSNTATTNSRMEMVTAELYPTLVAFILLTTIFM